MENEEYVDSFNDSKINRARVLEALNKYGKNKWWLSEISEVIGYFQLFEPILVVKFGKFHKGLEKLLNRPVFTSEFPLNYEGLKKEAEKAKNNLLTDEDRKKALVNSVRMLKEYCYKTGKGLIKISINLENENGKND